MRAVSAKKNAVVDALVFAVYLVAANPAFTGIDVHEWIGLGAFAALLVHVMLHADWVVETACGLVSRRSWRRAGNFAIDALLLVTLLVCVVSGMLVSGAVLPSLGLYADGYYFWNPLHAISAKILLALLLVHIAVHLKWIGARLGKGKGDGHGER